MFDALGPQALDRYFRDDEPVFAGIYPTTLKELVESGSLFVMRIVPNDFYQFTGAGWFVAAKARGMFDESAFKNKIGQLCGALKAKVKERKEPLVVPLDELASDSSLDRNWVFNVIEGKVLEKHFHRRGAYWIEGGVGGAARHVKIPIDFGHPLD